MNSRFFYPTREDSLGTARFLERKEVAVERELTRRFSRDKNSSGGGPQSTPTVLIAEDNEDGLFMLRTLLELKGYRVLEARNGSEAIESALRDLPDLMLLDLQLPLMDGLSVTRQFRSRAHDQHVPIIIVSGHNPLTHAKVARAAGCDEYLLKPIDMDALDRLLETFAPLNGKSRSVAARG